MITPGAGQRLRAAGATLLAVCAVGCASGGMKPSDGTAGREPAVGDLPPPGDLPAVLPDFYPSWPEAQLPPDASAPLDAVPPPPDLPPVVPDTGPPLLTAPFSFDFDTSNGGLVATHDWQWGQIAFATGPNCDTSSHTPPPAGHSGKGVWGTVLNDCYSPLSNAADPCTNQDAQDDSVLKLVFRIPGTMSSAVLVYWEWNDYFLTWDWTEVYLNGSVVRQDCTGSHVKPTAWVKRVIDLKALVGQTVTLEFHFMATGVINYAGWYLDDLSVTETLPP